MNFPLTSGAGFWAERRLLSVQIHAQGFPDPGGSFPPLPRRPPTATFFLRSRETFLSYYAGCGGPPELSPPAAFGAAEISFPAAHSFSPRGAPRGFPRGGGMFGLGASSGEPPCAGVAFPPGHSRTGQRTLRGLFPVWAQRASR